MTWGGREPPQGLQEIFRTENDGVDDFEEARLEKKLSPGRKRLLINPGFQFRFMGWMSALALGVIAVMHLAHQWFFFQLREQARMAGLQADHVFYRFIESRQTELDAITVLSFVAVVVVVSVVGLVLSHKIAGPMYRLRVHLEEFASTRTPRPLNFREGDFFSEIPDAYNLQFKQEVVVSPGDVSAG